MIERAIRVRPRRWWVPGDYDYARKLEQELNFENVMALLELAKERMDGRDAQV